MRLIFDLYLINQLNPLAWTNKFLSCRALYTAETLQNEETVTAAADVNTCRSTPGSVTFHLPTPDGVHVHDFH